MISHFDLTELLSYDPTTGIFRWNVKPARRILAGAVAGCKTKNGGCEYVLIGLRGRMYLAHRLAWFYVTGIWPTVEIDHRDGCGLNNRYLNLREGTRAQNAQNQGLRRTNTSGYRGVRRHRKRWQAIIGIDGAYRCLGTFDTPEEAAQAYLQAKAKLHTYQPVPRD